MSEAEREDAAPPPAELRSERLVLDQPGEDDIDAIVEYCQDPVFERYLTVPWPYERRHAEGFVREFVPRGWRTGQEFTWAIRARTGGTGPERRFAGVIGCRTARHDVGFWLGAAHRGQGFMTEALDVVVEWLFADRGWPRVTWEAVVGNLASARVARAGGFRFTGEGPVAEPFRDGSRPPAWHAVLERDDDRDVKPGWPL